MRNKLCLILMSVFLLNTAAFASNTEYPDDLFISITNHGNENCVLTHSQVLDGQLYKSGIPLILKAQGSTYSFTLTGTATTSADLTYTCGNSKTITLHMDQSHKSRHIHTSINASVLDATNITETHKTTVTYHNREGGYPEDSGHQHPGTVEWKLFF
jgi:hypothetical protein